MELKLKFIAIDPTRTISQEEINRELEVIRLAKNDLSHFKWLYDRYFNIIFRFIYRRTDDEDVTADLTSQTFLKAMRNLKKYVYKGVPFSAWLYKIATNEVYKYYRSGRRKMIFSFEEEIVHEMIENRDPDKSMEDHEWLTMIMKQLNESEIEVLQLRFFEGKTFAEIAFILEVSEASAKMRTYRSVEKLKALVKGGKNDPV